MTTNEIKFIKKLHQKKYRKEEGKYFVEGKKLTLEALDNCKEDILKIYRTTEDISIPQGIDHMKISEKEMSRISALKTASPFLTLMSVKKDTFSSPEISLYLENIKDPGNFGTIIRTADWFGISTIYYSPECVDTYNPKLIQSTMGSFFRVQLIEEELEHLKSLQVPVLGATLDGEELPKIKLPRKYCLVIGSESHGISTKAIEILDQKIKIPGKGKAESLNASIAAGILMFALNPS